jgi:hypothetical protein
MGATGICPGTLLKYDSITCELEDDEDEEDVVDLVCPIQVVQDQAGRFLYKSDTVHHKGRGHSDPDDPDQVLLFLAFAESRKSIVPSVTCHFERSKRSNG